MNLSVIIPIYNTPNELLEHCLASIKENLVDMEGVEVLMINDGSTAPHIASQLQQKASKDSRFLYIYKPNSGVSETRNLGIEKAKGEYITFVDADDYLEPDALQYMLDVVKTEQVDMAMFGFCNDEERIEHEDVKRLVQVDDDVLRDLISDDLTCWYNMGTGLSFVWAKIYRREILVQKQVLFLQDIVPNEDGYFNLCLLSQIPAFYLDNRIVYHYVTFQGSAVRVFSDYTMRVAKSILPKLENFVNTNYPQKSHLYAAITKRALTYIRFVKTKYLTHPANQKSFWQLKGELDDLLAEPIIRKCIRKLRLTDTRDKIELKNIILLKLHLYWIFLITERNKRKLSFN
jgi:glycosyltransferase involved in cell wall biosynthesis